MEHTPYKCKSDCDDGYCIYCRGGLISCTVCGATESTLTTDCFGKKLSLQQLDLIRLGLADYKNNQWIYKK